MSLKSAIAATYMRFSRWTFVHEDIPPQAIVIGGPHTSNWDGFLMVMAFWRINRPYKFLVKDSAMRAPVIGRIVRWVGGISVNRSGHHGVVGEIVKEAAASDTFTLIIAPKGTRSPQPYWKSGFYRIALETGFPVQLGFINRKKREYGWGGNITITGDVSADMDRIRAFYEGKTGFNPENTSVPRLRAEDDDAARAHLLGTDQ
ncbi:MAG: acyltransferase [Actinomycetaceae bacterium]|nr:acyltransferase [Actinomycetaceae bacterium]